MKYTEEQKQIQRIFRGFQLGRLIAAPITKDRPTSRGGK